MSPMARSVYLLLVILVSAIAERSFDYDVDDLDQVESFIWDSSDAPHMGPTRPGPPNPAPAENLIGNDPNLHQQISEIVRQIIAEYSHRNQLPAGVWVGGKHMGPGLQQMPFAPPNPCYPPIGPSTRGHASRRGQHLLPQKTGVSSLPKNLPADDVYYASQSNKLPRKVVKQGVFQPKRKPQVSQSITVVEQGKNGEWFKVPVDKVATGLGRRNYEVVELHKADDVRKVGPGLNNGEESIHYIHIQES
ncbi:hypothetical protein MTO96_001769 [Rhipicephalus appendiculatus]